jgi:transposase
MLDLPDPRSLSPESLELLRSLVVRAIVDLGMSQVDASKFYGVSPHTISQWVGLYREQGEDALAVKAQGRPRGAGRALTPEQEHEIRALVVDSTPQRHQIASATWTRQAVAELIASRLGIELTLQGVGKYLRRWGLTPQKPARQAREQDPEEVREFVEQTLPEVHERAQAEGAQLHFVDEVGVKAQDQIGESYAPRGETPVLEVPKTHLEQDVISSVTPDGKLVYWPFPGTMTGLKFIEFLELLVSQVSKKVMVFADRHPAHEAGAVEAWLEGRESDIEVYWLPRYAPAYNPDEFLNNDLKQELETKPMPKSGAELRELIVKILDSIASKSDRIRGYFKQSEIDLALN